MNKVFKALILGGLLIVAGSILAGIGIAISSAKGKTNSKAGISDWVEYTYVAEDPNISALDVSLTFEEIKLEPTTDKKISIVYKDKADNATKIINEQNNTLSVKSKSTSLGGFFNVTDLSKLISESQYTANESYVIIKVPENYDGKLYIGTASGDISMSDIVAQEGAHISAVSGNIDIDNLKAEKDTDIASTSGDITICNSVFNDALETAAISGEITLKDTSTVASATMTTTSGDIKLTNMEAKGTLQLNTVSGDVKSNTTGANNVDIETTSGDVSFDETSVETSFSASTISGDCNVAFTDKLANYSTYIQTTSGDCNIPRNQNSGGKNLSITTTSGDINITFVEN